MDFTLRPDLQRYVEEKLRDGQYASLQHLVEEALLVLREEERSSPIELEEIRRDLRAGLEASERGDTAPWDPQEIKTLGRRLMNPER